MTVNSISSIQEKSYRSLQVPVITQLDFAPCNILYIRLYEINEIRLTVVKTQNFPMCACVCLFVYV